ncbi:MAG TPA: tetratricopeptide repeat protein [Candidatus Obscuribacterales bacterium]
MDIDNLDWGPDEVHLLISDADTAVSEKRYGDAAPLYRRAIEMLETPNGTLDPDLANCLHKLGDVYCALEEFEAACPILERLLDIGQRVLGPSDPDVITIALRLATTYDLLERHGEAGSMYAKAVQMAEDGLPAGDPFTNKIRTAYAEWLSRQTRPKKRTEVDTDRLRAAEEESKREKATRELDKMTDDMVAVPVRQAPASATYRMLKKLDQWQQLFIPAVLSTVLLIGAFFWMQNLVKESGGKAGTAQQTESVEDQRFETIDGSISVALTGPNEAVWEAGGNKRKIPYVVLRNKMIDAGHALEGYFLPHEMWFEQTEDVLRSEDGTSLYKMGSPEAKVVAQIEKIVDYAENYRKKHDTYPANAEKWVSQPLAEWTNPITGKADQIPLQAVSLDLGLPFIFGGSSSDEEILSYLSDGAPWSEEPEPAPCAIRCLSIFGGEKSVDGFKSDLFYIRGYDRNAVPIISGAGGGTYFVALKGGPDRTTEKTTRAHAPPQIVAVPQRICISKDLGDKPFELKYLGPTIVGAIAGFFFVLWCILDLPSRLRKEKRGLRMLEVLTIAFLILLSSWHVLRMF